MIAELTMRMSIGHDLDLPSTKFIFLGFKKTFLKEPFVFLGRSLSIQLFANVERFVGCDVNIGSRIGLLSGSTY